MWWRLDECGDIEMERSQQVGNVWGVRGARAPKDGLGERN